MSNVATIGVSIVADATKLQAGLQKALDALDSFGNKFQRAANKVAAVGAAMTALGGKMIADAAKYDSTVKAAVNRLGNAYDNLAVRIGSALVPALNAVTSFVGRLVAAWDSLSPATRKTIADIALLVAKILVFVGVAGAVVGIVGDLAGLAAVLLPILPVTLAIAAGLAGIALLLGAGYGAWKEYGDAITKSTREAFDAATDFAENYFQFMVDNIKGLANLWLGLLKTVIKANEEMKRTGRDENVLLGDDGKSKSAIQRVVETLDPIVNGDVIKRAALSIAETLGGAAGGVKDAAIDGIKTSLKNFLELSGLGSFYDRFAKMLDEAGTGFANKIGKALGVSNALSALSAAGLAPGSVTGQIGGANIVSLGSEGIYDDDGKHIGNRQRSAAMLSATEGFQNTGFAAANRIRAGASGPAIMRGLDKAEVLEAYADRFVNGVRDSLNTIATGLAAAGHTLLSKMKSLGNAISAGIQGAQQGGWIGALVAVFAQLVQGTKAFERGVDIAEGSFMAIASNLEGLVDGAQPLLTSITMVVDGVFGLLAPVLDQLGSAFSSVAGVMVPLALLLKGLAPMMALAMTSLAPVFGALSAIVTELNRSIGVVVFGILKMVHGIAWLWNEATGYFQTAFFNLAQMLGDNFLGQAAGSISLMFGDLKIPMGGLNDAIAQTEAVINGQTDAVIAATSAQWGAAGAGEAATTAMDRFSEQLTNVPQGFKVAAARFNAMSEGDGAGSSNFELGGTAQREGGLTVIVQGNVIDTEGLMAIVAEGSRKGRFRQTGARVP